MPCNRTVLRFCSPFQCHQWNPHCKYPFSCHSCHFEETKKLDDFGISRFLWIVVVVSHCLLGSWCETNLVPGRQMSDSINSHYCLKPNSQKLLAGSWQGRQDAMGSSYCWGAIQAAKQNNPVLLMVPWSCPSDLQLLLQKDTDLRTDALSYM